jgi:hypothetical protein
MPPHITAAFTAALPGPPGSFSASQLCARPANSAHMLAAAPTTSAAVHCTAPGAATAYSTNPPTETRDRIVTTRFGATTMPQPVTSTSAAKNPRNAAGASVPSP